MFTWITSCRQSVNCEEAFKEVVPEESSVPMSGSSTPPPPSVTVSKTTEDQPAETQKPVAGPIPQSSTPDPPAAQEPVVCLQNRFLLLFRSLNYHLQYSTKVRRSLRNTPVRAEPRYPARERKAPDRLDL